MVEFDVNPRKRLCVTQYENHCCPVVLHSNREPELCGEGSKHPSKSRLIFRSRGWPHSPGTDSAMGRASRTSGQTGINEQNIMNNSTFYCFCAFDTKRESQLTPCYDTELSPSSVTSTMQTRLNACVGRAQPALCVSWDRGVVCEVVGGGGCVCVCVCV